MSTSADQTATVCWQTSHHMSLRFGFVVHAFFFRLFVWRWQTAEELVEAFYNFDYDQDGYIAVEDMRDLLADNGYNMPQSEIDEFIQMADPQNSGFIEYKAFSQLLMCNPEQM